MNQATFINTLSIFNSKKDSLLVKLALLTLGVTGLALMAQISIQLPFTPVPLTGQSLGVLIIASAYGFRLGAMTTLAYILLGASGLPIFANQEGGLSIIFGATGGYLIGFFIASMVIGSLAEKGWDRKISNSFAMFTIGHLIIFCLGMVWLATVAPEVDVLAAGLIPFIPGAIIKTLIATGLFPLIWRLQKR